MHRLQGMPDRIREQALRKIVHSFQTAKQRSSPWRAGRKFYGKLTALDIRAAEYLAYFTVQRPVGCKYRNRVEVHIVPIEVSKCTARLFDDDRQRPDIQNIDVRFDDHVERAPREQMVMHEVAVAAGTVGAADEFAEARPEARARKRFQVAARNGRA